MYNPVLALLERAGEVTICIMLLLHVGSTKTEMVWLLQLPPLHRQADEGTYPNNAVQCRFRAAGSFCNSLQLRSTLFLKC